MKYDDRHHAGKVLASKLQSYTKKPNVIVLALPRGGVPVGFEVAKLLDIPFDIFIVRKLGLPTHEELAVGAIAANNIIVLNEDLLQKFSLTKKDIDPVISKELQELKRREFAYRGSCPFPELKDKTIILVDDGIATGASMRAAITALKKYYPKKIILAVPVASEESYREMRQYVDDIICPLIPSNFYAVGLWYNDFSQTSDEEVLSLLSASKPA